MKTLSTTIKKIFFKRRITISQITILGMFLALMVVLKYALGFVPGIELVSFMFIILALFLPFFDLAILVIAFNCLILVIYGFGSWWLVYWIIWPIDVIGTKLISKMTHNRLLIGMWGFIAGFSVFFWYFLSDLLIFGLSYAILNLITGLPINLIEGLVTMVALIIIGPSLAKVFHIYGKRFWQKPINWNFRPIKNERLQIICYSLVLVIATTAIILLFVYNHLFIDWQAALARTDFNQDLAGDGSISDFEPTI